MRPKKLAGASWVGWYMPRETDEASWVGWYTPRETDGGSLVQLDDICLEELMGSVRLVGILKNRGSWLMGWWAGGLDWLLVFW